MAEARPEALAFGALHAAGGRQALVDHQRHAVDERAHLVELQGEANHVDVGRGLQALDVAPKHLAQRDELRAVAAGEARIGRLQRHQRRLHIAGQLQLLRRDGEDLVDLGQRPLVAIARQLLVQRFQCHLLVLRFGELAIQLREARLRFAHGLLRRAGGDAGVAAVGVAVMQLERDFLAQRRHAAAVVPPLPQDDQRQQHHGDGQQLREDTTRRSVASTCRASPGRLSPASVGRRRLCAQ